MTKGPCVTGIHGVHGTRQVVPRSLFVSLAIVPTQDSASAARGPGRASAELSALTLAKNVCDHFNDYSFYARVISRTICARHDDAMIGVEMKNRGKPLDCVHNSN